MTRILHLTFSSRGEASHSSAFGNAIVTRLIERHADATVIRREFGDPLLGHVDAEYASSLATGRHDDRVSSPSSARSDAAIADLLSADIVVVATPMHNFSVPSALKSWIDHVFRVARTFAIGPDGKIGLVPDRPVFIAIASGGVFQGAGANQPDFLIPYLTTVLGCIGLQDLCFLPLQATARLTTDELADQRRQLLARVDQAIGMRVAA